MVLSLQTHKPVDKIRWLSSQRNDAGDAKATRSPVGPEGFKRKTYQTCLNRVIHPRQYDGVRITRTGMISIRPIHMRNVMSSFVVAGNGS